MVTPSTGFVPVHVIGMTTHPENPLEFDFIFNTGDTVIEREELKDETIKLVKYFLAALTVPDEEQWVNLSPYEGERIIPQAFSETDMGRDLLAQDYLLKQLTASLMYPEEDLGAKFWDRVYSKAYESFGTTEMPVNTFNKVWIVPDKAVVYEHNESVFITESHLKVMLEGDYLALAKNLDNQKIGTDQLQQNDVQTISDLSSDVVKDILIPEIEKKLMKVKLLLLCDRSSMLCFWRRGIKKP